MEPHGYTTSEVKVALQVLELGHQASLQEVRRKYLGFAKDLHPDKSIDDPQREAKEQRFAEVSSAYQTIVEYYSRGRTDASEGTATFKYA